MAGVKISAQVKITVWLQPICIELVSHSITCYGVNLVLVQCGQIQQQVEHGFI